MGVLFFEHLGGKKYYVCKTCNVYLTKDEYLASTRFMSVSGPARLFKKVVNVIYGEKYPRMLVTGPHYVREAFCKKCGLKIGWFYEFAERANQQYKEGNTILEDTKIRKEESDFD